MIFNFTSKKFWEGHYVVLVKTYLYTIANAALWLAVQSDWLFHKKKTCLIVI